MAGFEVGQSPDANGSQEPQVIYGDIGGQVLTSGRVHALAPADQTEAVFEVTTVEESDAGGRRVTLPPGHIFMLNEARVVPVR